MNIFEPEEVDQVDLRECKIKYLHSQNQWMGGQFEIYCQLISKYKGIVSLLSRKENINPEESQKLIINLNQLIKRHTVAIAERGVPAQQIVHDELEINPLIFIKLIRNFEERIQEIRNISVHTENILQKLEAKKKSISMQFENEPKPDTSLTIKSLDSYDIYPRVFEKYKRRVMDLKIRRNNLEMQIKSIELESKKQIESMCSTVESQSFRKGIPTTSQIEIEGITHRRREDMTIFEQAVLIYKKKKFTNNKLREKVASLKKQIANKRTVVSKLHQVNDERIWDTVELFQDQQGEFFYESNISSISVMNRSTTEKMEFDVDLSKIVNPKKLKTFKALTQQRKLAKAASE